MKYVKCDTCGKSIPFNSEVIVFDGFCGVFCSGECFADAHGTYKTLDADLADNCGCEVFHGIGGDS